MFAIMLQELRQRRWSLIWWGLGVVVLVALDMSLYASLKSSFEQTQQIYNNLPSAFKALFADNTDFLSPVGFLNARVYFLLLPLVLTIFAIGAGANALGKEEQQGTLELLLARPVSRGKLLAAKALAVGVALALLGIVALVTAWICLKPGGFTGITYGAVTITTIACIALCALFGAIAFTISAMGKRGSAIAIASLFAVASYLIASLESLASWLKWPAKLLPYHYYQPAQLLGGTSTGAKPLTAWLILIILLAILSWLAFRRRDIS